MSSHHLPIKKFLSSDDMKMQAREVAELLRSEVDAFEKEEPEDTVVRAEWGFLIHEGNSRYTFLWHGINRNTEDLWERTYHAYQWYKIIKLINYLLRKECE